MDSPRARPTGSIIPLHLAGALGREEAGGKASVLGALAANGMPVPPGVVLTTTAFDAFVAPLRSQITAILVELAWESVAAVSAASEQILNLLREREVPENQASEALATLGSSVAHLAVRSSASVEDGFATAWAGQFDTYLCVTPAELASRIRDCWASAYSPRALQYGRINGVSWTDVRVAVIVQELVDSHASGVSFSFHPTEPRRNVMAVEAVLGLGEALVSGTITPDYYEIDRSDGRLRVERIAAQQQKLCRGSAGGTLWAPVAQAIQNQRKVCHRELTQIVELTRNVEALLGFPCDVEWAFAGSLFLLQARPITALLEDVAHPAGSPVVPEHDREAEFWLHFTQDDFGVLMMDLLLAREAYGQLDYVVSVGAVTRAYLTRTGRDEARTLGLDLLSPAFQSRLLTDADLLLAQLRAEGPYREDVQVDWVNLRRLWTELWRICRYCDEPTQLPIESVLLATLGPEGTRSVLAAESEGRSVPVPDDIASLVRFVRRLGQMHIELHRAADVLVEGLRRIGNRLHEHYQLDIQDFWAMRADEVEYVLSGRGPTLDLSVVKARRAGCVMYRDAQGWQCDVGERRARLEELLADAARPRDNSVRGTVAYPGIATGTVVKHLSWSGLTEIPPGSVLVTGMTNPQMIPYLTSASGIITDEGGLMCHAAIIARELRKPCVVGTRTATQVFSSGDVVSVDAYRGSARILGRPPSLESPVPPVGPPAGKWILQWSGESWPLFDSCYQYAPGFYSEWLGLAGVAWSVPEIVHFRDRIQRIFIHVDGFDNMRTELIGRFNREPAFLLRSAASYRVRVDRDLAALRRVRREGDIRPGSPSLSSVLSTALMHVEYNAAVDRFDYYMELIFGPELEVYLRDRLTVLDRTHELADCYHVLLAPRAHTTLSRERSDFYAHVSGFQRNHPTESAAIAAGELTTLDVVGAQPMALARLRLHGERWGWIDMLTGGPSHTLESLCRDMDEVLRGRIPARYIKRRTSDHFDARLLKRRQAWLGELRPPRRTRQLISGLRAMSFLRSEDYATQGEISFHLKPILEAVAETLSVSYEDLKEFTPSEVKASLAGCGPVDTGEAIRRRQDGYLLTSGGSEIRLVFDVREIDTLLAGLGATIERRREIRGVVAVSGHARGPARLIMTLRDATMLKGGEIAVVGPVAAEVVPLLALASGIVAEGWSLTSHPAVVARELGIPCIVGTAGVTSILSTGDMVSIESSGQVVLELPNVPSTSAG